MKTIPKGKALVWLVILVGLLTAMTACTGPRKIDPEKAAAIARLDSLNQKVEYQDSIESNLIFYEEAFVEYKKLFPGVDKSAYLRFAKGKDQDFCLFKPNPAQVCLETADKFNDLDIKPPAKDAYRAGLLSEGYNDGAVNIRLWGSLAQLAIEENENTLIREYLGKILEVDSSNVWAKKTLLSLPKE